MNLYKSSLIIGTISILIASIGLGVGIGTYFILENEEIHNARVDFIDLISYRLQTTTNTIGVTIRGVHTVTSLFNVSNKNINPYDDFTPFIERSQSNIIGLFSIGWIGKVSTMNRDSYISNMRQYGRDYNAFNITSRNSVGALVPVTYGGDYYPMTYVVPLSSNIAILGFDINSEPIRRNALNRALISKNDAVTSRIFLPHKLYTQPGILYLSPLIDNAGYIQGFGVGVFLIGEMMSESMLSLLSQASVYIFDTDRTNTSSITGWNDIYSTDTFLWCNTEEYGASFGSNNTINTLRYKMKEAPFTYKYVVSIGDRYWDIVFIPKNEYIASYHTGNKWISLFGCIVAGVLIDIIICTIYMFLIYKWRKEQESKDKEITIIRNGAERYRILLNHIGELEESKKNILNSIPDYIVVTNNTLKILYANNAFNDMFGYTSIEMRNGIYLTNISEIDILQQKENMLHNSIMKPRLKSNIPISYTYRSILMDEHIFSTTITELSCDSPYKLNMKDSVYIFVIKNTSMEQKILISMKQNQDAMNMLVKNSEFVKRWTANKDDFRKDILQFCKKDKCDENILFITDVETYHSIGTLDMRINMQIDMINKYLNINSKYELNIDRTTIEDTIISSKNRIGDITTFDTIYEMIRISISNDIYPRYVKNELSRISTDSKSSK